MAGQDDLVEFFLKNNEEIAAGVPKAAMQYDPYRIMASQIYGTPVNLISPDQRQVGKVRFVYDTKKGKSVIPKSIWGGALTENWTQALARVVVGEQMLLIARKYKTVLTVHDSVVCVVPEHEAETAQEYVELCMRLRPSWAPDLPLNCEAGYGPSYGDC
jgi:hypothetical protein